MKLCLYLDQSSMETSVEENFPPDPWKRHPSNESSIQPSQVSNAGVNSLRQPASECPKGEMSGTRSNHIYREPTRQLTQIKFSSDSFPRFPTDDPTVGAHYEDDRVQCGSYEHKNQ